jgi:enolase-phosphatase E1
MSIKVILLDVEGTTTPIDFVHRILFPYAKAKLGDFVAANLSAIGDELAQLTAEHASDPAYRNRLDVSSPDSVTEYLTFLLDTDRKSTPLKSLEGKIWQEGYESGALRSQVFDDVPAAFERWTIDDKRISIYSSGSVLVQKLLFRYTNQGDLTRYLSAHFDSNIGPKRASLSYGRISSELKTLPDEMLFISDTVEELEAANRSGLNTLLSVRPGNAVIANPAGHRVVHTFDEVS